MTYEHILVKHEAAITDIVMNRPERRNALSEAHMSELIDAFRAAGARRETRAVILSGNGPAFSAGHDLREMLDRDVETFRRLFDRCVELMTTVQSISQPVIAQ